MYEMWRIHGVGPAGENQSGQGEICSVSFSLPQFSHGLAWWNDTLQCASSEPITSLC